MQTHIIFHSKEVIIIGYFLEESTSVIRAIHSLGSDLRQVLDCQIQYIEWDAETEDFGNCNIVVATKKVYPLQKEESVLEQWEGYVVREKNGRIFICGADSRGTIYGIYELSRYIGVSPWYFFADVPIKKKCKVKIPSGYYQADYPSVQYRGIFLNDEEELEEWAKKHTEDGTIGPQLYEKIYELLLRLKGNYIWPAMHVNYFQENPENARLANEMGIVVGTSHCDMLMRSNQNEWNPWLRKNGYKSNYNAVHSDKMKDVDEEAEKEEIFYDYSIPGKNRDELQRYWSESVQMNRDYEVCYTIGMRGVHDFGFSTREIDLDESLSEVEKETERIRLLEKVMEDQRKILQRELGVEEPGKILQSFIPYKEVLNLYDKGLQIPNDVTLIWVNDNFGHVRRYPNEDERKRKGGHGLYYHVSYWGTSDMSYLFFNSIPLAHITFELRKAYQSGIQKMWILNVGALKPLEMEMEAFLQYGWDAGKKTEITTDIHAYTAHWFNQYFSGEIGEQLAELYEEFAQITNARKVEHMSSLVFPQAGYGDEAGERVCLLENIFNRANHFYEILPEEERDAFFQLFLFKVHASYYMNLSFYFADRSILSYHRGNNRAADVCTAYSGKAMKYLETMLYYYNKVMCNGKWDGIMTPNDFPPPGICFYPVRKPSICRKRGGMKIILWDGVEVTSSGSIHFCEGGAQKKWLEIGNQGINDIHFVILNKPVWLEISETEGVVQAEKRIYFSVCESEVQKEKQAKLQIINQNENQIIELDVSVKPSGFSEKDFHGSIQADGAVTFYADHFQDKKDIDGAQWQFISGIGRGFGNAMMANNAGLSSLDEDIKGETHPYLEYSFWLTSKGEFPMDIIRFLTLNSRERIRIGIGIDGGTPQIVESETTDEWRGRWKESVMNNGEVMSVLLPEMKKGKHTMQLYMIDNFVTIHKLIIYTEAKRQTFFGPHRMANLPDCPLFNLEQLEAVRDRIYQSDQYGILPKVVYADKSFWNYNRIYMKNDFFVQEKLGEKRYEKYYRDREETSIFSEFGKGVLAEQDGIVAWEAEYALENSPDAYLTSDQSGLINWGHVRAETDGGTGLAMQVFGAEYTWNRAKEAPGMHYRIKIENPGSYYVWMLVLFENHMSDTCYLAVDGEVQPLENQYSKGNLFTYGTAHIYFWSLMSSMELTSGLHTFSVYAGDTGLQIDRIYLSQSEELPPADFEWKSSKRE